jgi:predicted RNase H-like HicB family nuclease
MSVKSKNFKAKAVDRPFDKAVLAKAKQIADQYQIVLKFEDDEWYGHGLELPGARGDGKTAASAVADTSEALVTMVAYMIEEGQPIPTPACEGNRSVQINIRVTPEEKAVLESRSRSKGFKGLSDFIRTSVLVET